MTLLAAQIPEIARGETNTLSVDWGKNTAGHETGALKAGDTVASCTVSVYDKPDGSSNPTFGSVTVNVGAIYVNKRSCAAGEATTVNVTTGASQTEGVYTLLFTATTTNSKVIPRYVKINLVVP